MRELGLQAYRFSIAWSRVLPEGTGTVNERGLDFYERLVDALLAADIAPNATLFHWDLPAALDDRGGWLNRDIARLVRRLRARRVRARSAIACRCGRRSTSRGSSPTAATCTARSRRGTATCSRRRSPRTTCMRAHGIGVQAYPRRGARRPDRAGGEPRAEGSGDGERRGRGAARRGDAYMNRQYLDPVFKGTYPDEMRDIFGEAWPDFPADDFALIRQPIDFLGINYYTRGVVARRSHRPAGAHRLRAPARARVHGDRLGGASPVAHAYPALGDGALRTHPALRHRERRGVLRRAARHRRRGERPAARLVLPRASQGLPRRDRPAAQTCAATSPGACWTTTSGASATPSASASCT